MNKYLIIIIIMSITCMLIGYGVGFGHGTIKSLEWVSEKVIYFVKVTDGEVTLDAKQLAYALHQYKHSIEVCYPEINND